MSRKRSRRAEDGAASARQVSGPTRLETSGVSLDAEDIALARLQAHLRKSEAIHLPASEVSPLGRTSVRLPNELLRRVRERARRDGLTVSEVVTKALGAYLKSR